jgi:hypothetical protein
MTTAPVGSLRELARGLPIDVRAQRMGLANAASDAALLRAVVSAGVGAGEWRSTADVAERAFVVDDRTLRRWLADDAVCLPAAIRTRLLQFAWAFAVEVSS